MRRWIVAAMMAAPLTGCGTPPGLRIPDVPETETTQAHRLVVAGIGVDACPWYQQASEANRQAVRRAAVQAARRLGELPDGNDTRLRDAVIRQHVMLWDTASLSERCGYYRNLFGPAIREAEQAGEPRRPGQRR